MAENSIKILIVDDIPETVDSVKRMLSFDESLVVVGHANDGRSALTQVRKLDPDVVLMDINMPDMDGITATQHIRQRYPYTQVVILSVQNDLSYMRRAMRAGAHDFLPKPPMMDDLLSVVKRAGEIATEQRSMANSAMNMGTSISSSGVIPRISMLNGKVITIYSPKGGAGCTTVTTNLGIGLRSKKNKVLLVDGNSQYGELPVFMSLQPRFNILDLLPRIEEMDAEEISSTVSTHEPTGIDILPAPPRLEMAEQVDAEQFSQMIDTLRRHYNYILIDTPSYLNDVTLSAIEKADINLLLSTPEIPALKNINSFLMLYGQLGFDPEKILFILNFYDRRSGISPERISESLHQEIVLALPLDEKYELREAVKRGVPLMMQSQSHIFSKNIFLITNKIQEKISQFEEID
ncbi:MAG: response regulator [Anaerolineaceae bacterium]|nr:response regulator [Anaerolineaceae bacterium]